MDLIYRIYSVCLYDNQLDHDYVLLYNRRLSWTKEISSGLPYDFSMCLNIIYNLDKSDPNFESKSIDFMETTSIKCGIPMIKSSDIITLSKVGTTHLPTYNIYDIYWNETKSGVNIFDFEMAGIWGSGASSYSSYRIFEHREERMKAIRDNQLKILIER